METEADFPHCFKKEFWNILMIYVHLSIKFQRVILSISQLEATCASWMLPLITFQETPEIGSNFLINLKIHHLVEYYQWNFWKKMKLTNTQCLISYHCYCLECKAPTYLCQLYPLQSRPPR